MYIVWRWAIEATYFEPVDNKHENQKDYPRVVYAGVNPDDWSYLEIWRSRGVDEIAKLHKITLTEEQAKRCVVTEAATDKYVPLIEYEGGFLLPEVLIPFGVDAEVETDSSHMPLL